MAGQSLPFRYVYSGGPGFTATTSTLIRGKRTVQEAVIAPLRLALLDDHGPTGAFFDKENVNSW